ncbi:MAG TPA: histidine kinase dimerization/phosphoacceptor domain -containing protein, partial [Pseudorhodoplanes sp.]|nr:histidine kinase dimerization/phosphoacceptor domain -containing protein [Pseudorhodoplanes sp.]
MSLRRRLSVLVAFALLPPLLLTLYNTVRWQLVLEREARAEVLAVSRLVSAELAQVVEGARQLMVAMSKHPAVPDREAECTAYFKSVIAGIPLYRQAAVIDPHATFHCSTIPIPPNLNVRDRIYFQEPQITGQLAIGTLVTGRVTRESSIHISMPFTDASDRPRGVIVLILNPERMAQNLDARPWRSRYRITVFDREGNPVFNTPRDTSEEAQAAARELFSKIATMPSGTVDAKGVQDNLEIVGFVPVDTSPASLFVTVAIDREVALAEAKYINARSLAFALITMLLAIGSAWIATYFLINRPIRAIVDTARRRESGDTTAPFPDFSSEFGRLSSALSRMSDKIHDLVDQKGFLLRELQHRVMNSLALLSSVLEMQKRYVRNPTAREHLSRARDRVVAMGTVYRYLYQANASDHIEFSSFLKLICEESQNAYAGAHKPTISVEVQPLHLSSSHAISLAMLTHELITNALKHAYPADAPGPIHVSLK